MRLLAALAVIAAIAAGAAFARYGTLDPCRMVRQDFNALLAERYGQIAPTLAAKKFNKLFAQLDAGQCLEGWLKFHIKGPPENL